MRVFRLAIRSSATALARIRDSQRRIARALARRYHRPEGRLSFAPRPSRLSSRAARACVRCQSRSRKHLRARALSFLCARQLRRRGAGPTDALDRRRSNLKLSAPRSLLARARMLRKGAARGGEAGMRELGMLSRKGAARTLFEAGRAPAALRLGRGTEPFLIISRAGFCERQRREATRARSVANLRVRCGGHRDASGPHFDGRQAAAAGRGPDGRFLTSGLKPENVSVALAVGTRPNAQKRGGAGGRFCRRRCASSGRFWLQGAGVIRSGPASFGRHGLNLTSIAQLARMLAARGAPCGDRARNHTLAKRARSRPI